VVESNNARTSRDAAKETPPGTASKKRNVAIESESAMKSTLAADTALSVESFNREP
jgi:hypothetical protein